MQRFAAARARQVLYYEVYMSGGLVSLGAIGTSQIVLTPIDLVIAPLLLIHHLNARSLALVVEGVEGRDEEMLVKVGR